ncbi:hypothetical protein HanIR_Chr03g0136141 [Helianthus annuus]|nr:hypothetical protein HanIR_Chr03g0136141 [Helianthus annuus]
MIFSTLNHLRIDRSYTQIDSRKRIETTEIHQKLTKTFKARVSSATSLLCKNSKTATRPAFYSLFIFSLYIYTRRVRCVYIY